MGRSAGTGSPISFVCPKLRRAALAEHRTRVMLDLHRVERTGRTQPRAPAGSLGTRNMLTAFEYRCGCGHVGWTTHSDILHRPLSDTAHLDWRPIRVRPYGLVEMRDADGNTETFNLGSLRHSRITERWVEWRPRRIA